MLKYKKLKCDASRYLSPNVLKCKRLLRAYFECFLFTERVRSVIIMLKFIVLVREMH